MKAIKLYKIQWNLNGLTDAEKEKVLATLPSAKGFTTKDDNFNVIERMPGLLKKKYGYEVENFSFAVMRVVDTVDDLLLLCAPENAKVKNLYKKNGDLSAYGDECFSKLEVNVRQRIWKENHGTDVWEMPTILDEVMIAVENILGITWENHGTFEEIMSAIVKKIKERKNLKKKYETVDENEDETEAEA